LKKAVTSFFNQPLGFGYDDGINSAIQVCHLLDHQDKKMNDLINELAKNISNSNHGAFL
jgi:phosphomannomutase/phosphoglucomutase